MAAVLLLLLHDYRMNEDLEGGGMMRGRQPTYEPNPEDEDAIYGI